MNWTQSLVNDHKVILRTLEILRRIAERCENNSEPNAKDIEVVLNILRRFADDYHQGKEEAVLFPALMATGMTPETAPLRALLFEHDQERSLIRELQEALRTHKGKDFVHYAERLSEILSTHIYKEENILFEQADKVLTIDQRASVEKQFSELDAGLKPETRHLVDEQLRKLEWCYLAKPLRLAPQSMKEQTEDRMKVLRASQALLDARECLGCTHEGLIVTTGTGDIVENNFVAERILETPSLELKGANLSSFCAAPGAAEELIRRTRIEGRSLNRSLLLRASNGKPKIVNMSAQRLTDSEDSDIAYLFQDCADLRTMEERLVQSERLATIGKFASQVAHEIRNPLSSISLNLELLEDELKGSSDEAGNLIKSVMKEVDRLNGIVSEYLQFSRFPKPQLKRGRIDNVIRDVAATMKLPGVVRLEIDLSVSLPEVWLDENLLKQVLENLVRNGAEAIDGNGDVRIETETLDRFVAVRVSDTGCGIPANVQDRLFEPFFTTKPRGTGLGLATSQQIIFGHNGDLLVESEVNHGSTFTILLPL